MDSEGDVISAGFLVTPFSNIGVVKLDHLDGSEIWGTVIPGNSAQVRALAIDNNDDIIVAGGRESRFALLKLDGQSGDEIWRQELFSFVSTANSVALDARDDPIAAGVSGPGPDFAVIKNSGVSGIDSQGAVIKKNTINLRSRGFVPVAILGSDTFDVRDIDRTTLAFGPDGATPAHEDLGHPEDFDQDSFTDLLSHFRTAETGIVSEASDICVTGETFAGVPFEGCDSVAVFAPGAQ